MQAQAFLANAKHLRLLLEVGLREHEADADAKGAKAADGEDNELAGSVSKLFRVSLSLSLPLPSCTPSILHDPLSIDAVRPCQPHRKLSSSRGPADHINKGQGAVDWIMFRRILVVLPWDSKILTILGKPPLPKSLPVSRTVFGTRDL